MRIRTRWTMQALFMGLAMMLAVTVSPDFTGASSAAAMTASATADDAFASLQRRFERLHRALQSIGGMSDRERPLVEELREDFAAFNREHRNHLAGVVGELQLSIWLEDSDRVDRLFEALIEHDSTNVEFGKAWARYAESHYEQTRIDQLYRNLFELYPDNIDLRVERAERLKQRNQYHRALEALAAIDIDPTTHPNALLLKADCLFAEHRFEEAVEAVRSIPEFVLIDNRTLSRRVEDKILLIEEYIGLWEVEQELRAAEASADDLPRVQLNTERGVIVVELFENEAPNTVANFINLVEDGYYDGTRFHRVIPNFMAQGGDINSKDDVEGVPGQGGPGWRIRDEHDLPDRRNHFSGSLSMAKTGQPHTAGSQFYLTHEPTAHLNGRHTVFGRVLEGLDVVRAIERNDLLESAVVLRKRDHDYEVQKLFGDEQPPPREVQADDEDDIEPFFSPGRLHEDD